MSAKKQPARKSLSRELILEAALGIVGTDDMNELTMSRLGRALDADPSAVYRHFRNKDELLLAMADVMLEEVVHHLRAGRRTRIANLRHMTWVLRRVLPEPTRPRAGGRRPVHRRGRGDGLRASDDRERAGDSATTRRRRSPRVRALAEMTLGHILMTAEVIALPRKAQAFELEMAPQLLHLSGAAAVARAARGAARRAPRRR